MACKYTIGGQEDSTLDRTLKYAEDMSAENRSAEDVINILEDEGLSVKILLDNDVSSDMIIHDSLTSERLKTINNINIGAKEYFGIQGDLITVDKVGTLYKITVNQAALKKMKADPDEAYRSNQAPQGEEDVLETEEQELDAETASSVYLSQRKVIMDDATNLLIVNLQKQIDRLSKLPETQRTKEKLAEMEILKKELTRIDIEKANLDDYMDFVDFVDRTANRAKSLLDKIKNNYNTQSSLEEKAKMLKDLSELKKTIDAFYNDNNSRSLIFQLQGLIDELDDVQGDLDETVLILENAARTMKSVNDEFVDTGLEIQVDYLLDFAPPEINEELDRRITGIKENKRVDGLARFDVRYIKARAEGRDAVLALNIKQLEEKKIGRESILAELRQTHKDQSWASAFFSPVVYNKQASIQLFAETVRKALVTANDETLDFKYDVLQEAFRLFKDWKMAQGGISEDNVEKLYEDIIETITVSSLDENGERIDTPALAFVQEFDLAKFSNAKAAAFAKFRVLSCLITRVIATRPPS